MKQTESEDESAATEAFERANKQASVHTEAFECFKEKANVIDEQETALSERLKNTIAAITAPVDAFKKRIAAITAPFDALSKQIAELNKPIAFHPEVTAVVALMRHFNAIVDDPEIQGYPELLAVVKAIRDQLSNLPITKARKAGSVAAVFAKPKNKETNSKNASKSRLSKDDMEKIKGMFDSWNAAPNSYKNKSAFISEVESKGFSCSKTASKIVDCFVSDAVAESSLADGLKEKFKNLIKKISKNK